MPPIAPPITAFFRERLPLQRGASAPTCARYAYTFQLLFPSMRQRLHLRPSARCLEPLDAPIGRDVLASLETERGHRPSTRHTR
jgi:hypothetical protein